MKTIAITGGIGSGKTVVSDIMRASGYPVYDSDTEAKVLTSASPRIKKGLVELFGEEIYCGGVLDRKMLARHLFSDAGCRARVNAIIHPVVFSDFRRWREAQKKETVFLESAILFESGFNTLADEIWCVTAPVEVRVARVMKRNGMTRSQVEERISTQLPDEVIRQKSTHVIVNDGKVSVLSQLERYFFAAGLQKL